MRLIYKVLTFLLTVCFVYFIFNYSQQIKSYPIKTISFKGEFIYADEKGIRKQLQFFIGKDLIKIDILKIKESIKKNDWVNNVLVERRFPDTLFIEIFEFCSKKTCCIRLKIFILKNRLINEKKEKFVILKNKLKKG